MKKTHTRNPWERGSFVVTITKVDTLPYSRSDVNYWPLINVKEKCRMSTNRMSTNQAPGLTMELTRKSGATVPSGIRRRASANAPITAPPEPVQQVRTRPTRRTRRIPMPLLLIVGFIIGFILLQLGFAVMAWTNDVAEHWEGGSGYITAMNADVGHNGMSHWIAFYRDGTVVVVEFSSDYTTVHSYSERIIASGGSDHYQVTLTPTTISGKQCLVVSLGNGIQAILYNTGAVMSFVQPQ